MNIEFNGFPLDQYTNVDVQLALGSRDQEALLRANEFLKYGVRIAEVLRIKNKAYGNAVAVTGKEGVAIRMFDKFERIKNVSDDEGKEGDEPIVDTVHDEAGYSILWIMIHEKSPVFFNPDGSLKFEGDWRQTKWAYMLRESLGLNVLVDYLSEDEYDEIVLCQRCTEKSFDSHTKKCYNCDNVLQGVEIGGSSVKSPVKEDCN